MFQQMFLNFLFPKILRRRKNYMVFRNYLNYCSLNSSLDGQTDKENVNKRQVYTKVTPKHVGMNATSHNSHVLEVQLALC